VPGLEHEQHRISFRPEATGEQPGPERKLYPHGAVAGRILDYFAHDPSEVRGRGKKVMAGGDGVHEHLEGGKGAPVRYRRRAPAALCAQLPERRVPDGPVQVDVKVRLGQGHEGAIHLSAGSVVTPGT
jgi:hypothetical protein